MLRCQACTNVWPVRRAESSGEFSAATGPLFSVSKCAQAVLHSSRTRRAEGGRVEEHRHGACNKVPFEVLRSRDSRCVHLVTSPYPLTLRPISSLEQPS